MSADHSHRHDDAAALALLCVAQFVDVLGVTVVVVALPSIASDLGAGRETTQWVISLYALCFGGFLLLAGRAADLLGRRRLFVAGLLAFAATSLACGLAPSAPALLAARAAQGLAAAVVVPAALALLTARFPPGPERTRALGAWTAAGAGGGAAGFLLGGLVTAAVGWRWTFLADVPVALGAAALAGRVLAESRADATGARLDLGGAVLVTAGLGATIAGLTFAAERGLSAAEAIAGVLGGLVLLAAFAGVEARHRAPLLAPALLRRPGVAVAAAAGFALTATTSSAAVLVTSFLQDVLHRSPMATGLAFLPFSLLVVAGSLAGPRLVARIGTRGTVASGLAVVAGGVLLYLAAGEDGGLAPVVAAMAVTGAALGWASVAATTLGMSAVDRSEHGLAAGLLNTAAQVGTAAGVAIIGGIAAAVAGGSAASRGALVDGFRAGWLIAAAFAGLAALVALAAVRR